MKASGALVVETSSGFQVFVGESTARTGPGADPGELAAVVRRLFDETKVANRTCVLAPASTSCFFAILHPADEREAKDRAALAYEFENHLPIDAESFVADFQTLSRRGQERLAQTRPGGLTSSDAASGDAADRNDPAGIETGVPIAVAAVAVPIEPWRRIMDALDDVAVPVRSIVPSAMLAAAGATADPSFPAGESWLLIVQDDRLDSIRVIDRQWAGWKHMAAEPDVLDRHRLIDMDGGAKQVTLVGVDSPQHGFFQSVFPDARCVQATAESLWLAGARRVISDRAGGGFDLCRGPLGSADRLFAIDKQLRWLAVAAVLFFVSLAVAGWYRTHRIEQEIVAIRDQQETLFRDSFGGAKVPGAIVRRIRSEHAQAVGSRGASTTVEIPRPASDVVRGLIAAIPADLRFRIESLAVNDGRADLEMHVRTPVDAGKIATALASAGFQVDPPVTTQKDTRTFTSSIRARWIGKAADTGTSGQGGTR